jgi:hypothetical protein
MSLNCVKLNMSTNIWISASDMSLLGNFSQKKLFELWAVAKWYGAWLSLKSGIMASSPNNVTVIFPYMILVPVCTRKRTQGWSKWAATFFHNRAWRQKYFKLNHIIRAAKCIFRNTKKCINFHVAHNFLWSSQIISYWWNLWKWDNLYLNFVKKRIKTDNKFCWHF